MSDKKRKDRKERAKTLYEDIRDSHKYQKSPQTGEWEPKPSYVSNSTKDLSGPDRDKKISEMKKKAKEYSKRRKGYEKYIPKTRD